MESELGITMPESFKALVNLFGAGYWGKLLWVIQPSIHWQKDSIIALNERYRDHFPGLCWYPDADGLMPWGFSDSRTALFWDTNYDDPEAWPIVILEYGFEPERFPCSVTEFLVREIQGENGSFLLPANIRTNPHFYCRVDSGEWIDVCKL